MPDKTLAPSRAPRRPVSSSDYARFRLWYRRLQRRGLGLFLPLLALAGCASYASEPEKRPEGVAPNPAEVLPQGVARVVAPGVVEPFGGEIDVAGVGGGGSTEILVKEGERVEAGQILARLDDEVQAAQVEAKIARVKAAFAATKRARRGSRPEEKGEAAASAQAAQARADQSREAYEREQSLF